MIRVMNERMHDAAPDTLRSEHLKEGVRPIVACVGDELQFAPDEQREYWGYRGISGRLKAAHNVDYFEDPDRLRDNGYLNSGERSYVVSTVDERDKYSVKFRNCTGVAVVGTDRETQKNISLLSHEDPDHFLSSGDNALRFAHDLRERLREVKTQCEDGTIDAVIIGGNHFGDVGHYADKYRSSVALLTGEVYRVFGFAPVVITGPKTVSGEDDVYLDTVNRRLYIMRPTVGDTTTESFRPSDIDAQEKKWG